MAITDTGTAGNGNGAVVADLNTLNGYTTGNVDASAISFLEGTISALNTAYGSTSALGNGISGLGNETVTIDDTTDVSASDLNTLNGYTTGNVVATAAASLTGTISDLNTLYAASATSGNGVSGLGSEAVTVTDTSVSASELNTLNGYTNYNITVNATTITGELSAVNTLYGAKAADSQAATDGFTGLGAEAIVISDTGSVAASTLSTVASANDSGTLDASSAGTITGTEGEITTALGSSGANSTITQASNVALTVNSGTASLTNARTLDGLTTGVVTATIADTRVSALLGSTPLLDANSNNAFTITIGTADATVTAANLNDLNALTTVNVNAANVNTISSSSLSDINTLYTAGGVSGLGNEGVTVSDTGSIAAGTLTTVSYTHLRAHETS